MTRGYLVAKGAGIFKFSSYFYKLYMPLPMGSFYLILPVPGYAWGKGPCPFTNLLGWLLILIGREDKHPLYPHQIPLMDSIKSPLSPISSGCIALTRIVNDPIS